MNNEFEYANTATVLVAVVEALRDIAAELKRWNDRAEGVDE